MKVRVLGPVEVILGGEVVDLGTPKQRALLAALALSRGWPVSVDGIVDLLWDDAPPGVTATLQAYVSQLRRVLEPDRPRRAPATVLVTAAPGYALRVPEESIDAAVFEQAVGGAHRALQPLGDGRGTGALPAEELELTAGRLDEALALWRGTPYVELGDADPAVADRVRLEELRLVALEDRALVALALGRHATVAGELEALTATHPLRERLWGLRALALARSGRQADALEVLQEVRVVLDEELGLEPSPALRELQTAVLRQDPALEWTAPERRSQEAGLAPTPAVSPTVGGHPAATQVAPWPMVGRDADLALLVGQLLRAESGVPSYAVLTGEPGIGKSRLAAELVVQARNRGATVLIGRCSQDDGAPPLWPWKSILDGLGLSLLSEADTSDDEGGQFRAWERIVDQVRTAARERPVVVVLDDLHWADASTLRVLRLLVESVDEARLLVVVTWRTHPEPAGTLAEAAESLARMHALRIGLRGLSDHDAATVFESVADRSAGSQLAERLRERTDGNPFFLVEFARLAREQRGRDDLDGSLPVAVSDVLNQRLLRLPEDTVAALRVAAVIGRTFDTPTLAAVTGIDEDDVLDVIEPAQAAGLVREDGIDLFLFAHALVRDTLQAGLSASRRTRTHARIAAALEGEPGRELELALHWRSAGPPYADRAWRAAAAAAGLARRLHAYDQAAELLVSALESLADDPEATFADRYDLEMALVDAYRWGAQHPELVATVERAIETGKQMRDPEAVARAAISTTMGALWRSAPPGQVNELVVGALRGSLDRLPAGDSPLRCRTLLALANEGYNVNSYDIQRELVDAGLAMARRIGDPVLVMEACQVTFVALWTARTTRERLALISEARELARTLHDERAYLVSTTLCAGVLCELGMIEQMWETAAEARAEAQRLRIGFGEAMVDGLEVPWRAMAGDFDRAEELISHTRELSRRLSHGAVDEAVIGSLLVLRRWQGRSLEMVDVLEKYDETPLPFSTSVAVYLWRAGEHELARRYVEEHGAPLDHDNDLTLLAWCNAAEMALHLGDAELACDVLARLEPYAGFNCSVGWALASGPVDSYLAMAAAAVGDLAAAGRHADRALELADTWGIPLVADWVRANRTTHGY